jgi:hypothetical protein
MKDKVTQQLTNYCKRAPPKAMLDRYAELLESRLRLRFMASLSFVDQTRAKREYDLVKSIRRKLRKGQLILRVCDKGGGLHLSTKSDYERKAAEYRKETNAYQELSYNPLQELYTNVTNVLNCYRHVADMPSHVRIPPPLFLLVLMFMHSMHVLILFFPRWIFLFFDSFIRVSDRVIESRIKGPSNINELKRTKQLKPYYYNLIMPKLNAVKQAYMYFNSKAHKVTHH